MKKIVYQSFNAISQAITKYEIPAILLNSICDLDTNYIRAVSKRQLIYKIEIIKALDGVSTRNRNVCVCNGKVSLISSFLYNDFPDLKHITSIDPDPEINLMASKLNHHLLDNYVLTLETVDILHKDYSEFDIIIIPAIHKIENTFPEFLKLVPTNCVLVMQSIHDNFLEILPENFDIIYKSEIKIPTDTKYTLTCRT